MTSFAFNTMIGQVTPKAISAVGYKYYILFVVSNASNLSRSLGMLADSRDQVCNFTNAMFFWAILPETARRPLEEMNYLFTNAPYFVPTMDYAAVETHDLERRVEEVERKGSFSVHHEERAVR